MISAPSLPGLLALALCSPATSDLLEPPQATSVLPSQKVPSQKPVPLPKTLSSQDP
jgi:hypothetical protein